MNPLARKLLRSVAFVALAVSLSTISAAEEHPAIGEGSYYFDCLISIDPT